MPTNLWLQCVVAKTVGVREYINIKKWWSVYIYVEQSIGIYLCGSTIQNESSYNVSRLQISILLNRMVVIGQKKVNKDGLDKEEGVID